jgi:hypothetical protein
VGELVQFERILDSEVVEKLASLPCFNAVSEAYVSRLKELFPVFVSRLDAAIHSTGDNLWVDLCDEPKKKVKSFWKLDKSKCTSEEAVRELTARKNQSQSMYYCLYVILLWRHPLGVRRFGRGISSMEAFRAQYEVDEAFEKRSLECGVKPDFWSTVFHYRNVLILAAAIKPTQRNKGNFAKVACILAEGRVHPFGGGQSYTADRRGYLYEQVGQLFTPAGAMTQAKPFLSAVGRIRAKKSRGRAGRKGANGTQGKRGKKSVFVRVADDDCGDSDTEEGLLVAPKEAEQGSMSPSGGLNKRMANCSVSRATSATGEEEFAAGAFLSPAPRMKRKYTKRRIAPKVEQAEEVDAHMDFPMYVSLRAGSGQQCSSGGNQLVFSAESAANVTDIPGAPYSQELTQQDGLDAFEFKWGDDDHDEMAPSLTTVARASSIASRMQSGCPPMGAGQVSACSACAPAPSAYSVTSRQTSALDQFGSHSWVLDDELLTSAYGDRCNSRTASHGSSQPAELFGLVSSDIFAYQEAVTMEN